MQIVAQLVSAAGAVQFELVALQFVAQTMFEQFEESVRIVEW